MDEAFLTGLPEDSQRDFYEMNSFQLCDQIHHSLELDTSTLAVAKVLESDQLTGSLTNYGIKEIKRCNKLNKIEVEKVKSANLLNLKIDQNNCLPSMSSIVAGRMSHSIASRCRTM